MSAVKQIALPRVKSSIVFSIVLSIVWYNYAIVSPSGVYKFQSQAKQNIPGITLQRHQSQRVVTKRIATGQSLSEIFPPCCRICRGHAGPGSLRRRGGRRSHPGSGSDMASALSTVEQEFSELASTPRLEYRLGKCTLAVARSQLYRSRWVREAKLTF